MGHPGLEARAQLNVLCNKTKLMRILRKEQPNVPLPIRRSKQRNVLVMLMQPQRYFSLT